MAAEVIMPKLGNTVESCIILEWRKAEGDEVKSGEPLCDVETDKATFEVEAEEDGIFLKRFFEEGDDVPVLTTIAVIGKKGENIDHIKPSAAEKAEPLETAAEQTGTQQKTQAKKKTTSSPEVPERTGGEINVSPRAKALAEQKGISLSRVAGTGPGGRIIEKDVLRVINGQEPYTAAAAAVAGSMGNINITQGTGIGGRITSSDLKTVQPAKQQVQEITIDKELMGEFEKIPVKGIRKRISDLMYRSMQQTAQLTLNTSADAEALLEYRKKLKDSPEELGVSNITINDLLLFCVAKTLVMFKDLNAHFDGNNIYKFESVHLANAVDTKKGLIVPVIRNADKLSLKEISKEARMLMHECVGGTVNPDDLKGSTFTVTNLGAAGIESFTPILNYPEVAILGIGNIQLKPVSIDGKVEFRNHVGLSLTINHQVVDGAPGAKFLKELCSMIADIDLTLTI